MSLLPRPERNNGEGRRERRRRRTNHLELDLTQPLPLPDESKGMNRVFLDRYLKEANMGPMSTRTCYSVDLT